METNTMSQQEENQQIAARKVKLEALREAGVNPYPSGFKPDIDLASVSRANGNEMDPATLERVSVKVAGRIMLLRNFGKLTFATLQDESGRLQISAQRDVVGAELYSTVFRKIEVGDILGVEGHLFRTKVGELTVQVERFELLSKAVRPLPEKFHGLEDVETRYRQRYVDLIVNTEVREIFKTRSRVISRIRQFMEHRGFLEVETPMMHPIPGGATARPFVTHHNALDTDLYLRIAPELYLKRLIVGGFERVFEINRNFRNEGLSPRHNPEFTMMEFYQAYTDYRELMDFTEALVQDVVKDVNEGELTVAYQGQELDFSGPWARLTPAEAIVRYMEADAARITERGYLESLAESLGIKAETSWDDGMLLLTIFEEGVEHKLMAPTFIIDYPISVSPLSRRSDDNPDIAERFELFIAGREIANAFSELNDPADQASRFQKQVEAKDAGNEEAMHFDADYIRALEYGMPPTGGEGIGIDRLVMLLTDAANIREVLLFPQMKREG
ncbi:lysyl-tRNA synthetase [Magnetococcus marinus MC-1]|uniref:Lysine--tRNA ligase n=1 Tax=Magnetococcus marinus (strain ATCC BAA-1437 / JCM 17883 / MC-1) TaxID=156889 RepID=SYK_MAGMM|nr:lysine--tRNA ligase [Magnetococcus marinus]A0L6F7.1 RecName: Full=Lysine--tRNA ligase; AltName: Full=Lysyl-tRNA synthetase; Short=LysRS [Magnetococcus marinus MC-1]ABK43550.1 lysyl-tRNA synthetase [Magnetococcus marinus MC-1]